MYILQNEIQSRITALNLTASLISSKDPLSVVTLSKEKMRTHGPTMQGHQMQLGVHLVVEGSPPQSSSPTATSFSRGRQNMKRDNWPDVNCSEVIQVLWGGKLRDSQWWISSQSDDTNTDESTVIFSFSWSVGEGPSDQHANQVA